MAMANEIDDGYQFIQGAEQYEEAAADNMDYGAANDNMNYE